jgi:raffinose/stachyose/melibiose transport system permease protein
MTAVPFVRREARAKLPPDEPLIPQRRGGTAGYWLYLIPGLVLLTVVVLIPLGWNIYLSFTEWRGIKPPEFIGLENWIELFGDAKFWTSFQNSIWMIVAMVIFPTLIGLVLAALLFDLVGRKFGGRLASFLRATYYLPQILPAVIAGIVIGWILRPGDGALNTMLENVGLGALTHNWLGSPDTALISIMVVLVWIQIGYPVVMFMAGLQRVEPEMYEAAELDGANWFQRFRYISIAAIRPEIFVVVLTTVIAALKVFGPIFVLTRGGPGTATLVPSYFSYQNFFERADVGYGAAISTVLAAIIIAIAAVFIRFQSRRELAALR